MAAHVSGASSDGEVEERRNSKRAARRSRWDMGPEDVASNGRQPMPDGSDVFFRNLVRTLKRVGRKNRSVSDDSSSDDEDDKKRGWSLLGLLQSYDLHMMSAEHLPEEKKVAPMIERMLRDHRKGRQPMARDELSMKFAPANHVADQWKKADGKDWLASLTIAQWNICWWNRAAVQLAGQALCKNELLGLSLLFQRWHMLQAICVSEGGRVAKLYDHATWASAVATITAGGQVQPWDLATCDQNRISKIKAEIAAADAGKQKLAAPKATAKGGGKQRAGGVSCDICGKPGHRAAECWSAAAKARSSTANDQNRAPLNRSEGQWTRREPSLPRLGRANGVGKGGVGGGNNRGRSRSRSRQGRR